MARSKITLTREGREITATCAVCGHEITKADKKLAIEHMIGHLAGRHRQDIASLLAGNVTIVDNT